MRQKKLLILLLTLFLVSTAHAQLFKTIDVGKLQAYVYDHGCMSEDVRKCGNVYYFRGSYVAWDDIVYDDFEWPGGLLKSAGLLFGARNWTDTTGYTWDAHITGHAVRKRGNINYQFAVPDEEGYYIRRYMRYPLPQIIVNGMHLEAPFPMSGDEVAPEKMWGTADVMVESNVRLSMGLDVKQRVLAWSQPGHDDYIIWDWTFVNTGNVDRDPEIELPGQTLSDVYIARVVEAMINGTGDNKVMDTWAGTTEDQDTRLSYPQDDDSLRINYVTPLRAKGAGYDSYGKKPGTAKTLMDGARFGGSAVLFAPKSCNVPQNYPISDIAASNDPAQPSMHTSVLGNPSFIIWDFPGMDSAGYLNAYETMVMGVFGIDSTSPNFQDAYYMDSVYNVYDTTASGAKTHYEQPLDRWGELDPSRGWIYMTDIPESPDYRRFDQQEHFSIGPYQMEFGDTLRYVYAYVGGAISRKTSYLLGDAWNNGQATSYSWLSELDSAQMVDELSKRDPIFNIYYDTDPGIDPTPSLNDVAKDLLVATGKDSLFNNGMNAQRNFNANYNIPASPAPPTFFEVKSKSDMIELSWDYLNGVPSNLAGFKIFRAAGAYVFEKAGDIILGDWQFLDSVGPDERLYADTIGITPAADYYYALTAVSDGGVESGMFLTMTTQPARLTKPPVPGLDSVRVVPNPVNINSATLGRYPEGEGHKLTFVNLPGPCIITILTESGNLVTVIDHDVDAGTAQWYDGQRYSATDADQFPVSGIYIAHIKEKATGNSVSLKFVVVK
jgi:hypothetical protein